MKSNAGSEKINQKIITNICKSIKKRRKISGANDNYPAGGNKNY